MHRLSAVRPRSAAERSAARPCPGSQARSSRATPVRHWDLPAEAPEGLRPRHAPAHAGPPSRARACRPPMARRSTTRTGPCSPKGRRACAPRLVLMGGRRRPRPRAQRPPNHRLPACRRRVGSACGRRRGGRSGETLRWTTRRRPPRSRREGSAAQWRPAAERTAVRGCAEPPVRCPRSPAAGQWDLPPAAPWRLRRRRAPVPRLRARAGSAPRRAPAVAWIWTRPGPGSLNARRARAPRLAVTRVREGIRRFAQRSPPPALGACRRTATDSAGSRRGSACGRRQGDRSGEPPRSRAGRRLPPARHRRSAGRRRPAAERAAARPSLQFPSRSSPTESARHREPARSFRLAPRRRSLPATGSRLPSGPRGRVLAAHRLRPVRLRALLRRRVAVGLALCGSRACGPIRLRGLLWRRLAVGLGFCGSRACGPIRLRGLLRRRLGAGLALCGSRACGPVRDRALLRRLAVGLALCGSHTCRPARIGTCGRSLTGGRCAGDHPARRGVGRARSLTGLRSIGLLARLLSDRRFFGVGPALAGLRDLVGDGRVGSGGLAARDGSVNGLRRPLNRSGGLRHRLGAFAAL